MKKAEGKVEDREKVREDITDKKAELKQLEEDQQDAIDGMVE